MIKFFKQNKQTKINNLMTEIESIKIRFGDLLDELKQINGCDITNINFQALEFFADSENIERTNDSMKVFGNALVIVFEDGKHIDYFIDFKILNDLNEIQADGRTLLDHCSFISVFDSSNPSDLVVNRDMEDVICCFKPNEIFLSDNIDKHSLLEQAIYGIFSKDKMLEVEYKNKESKVKQKTLRTR